MAATIQLRKGDMFAQPSDLIIIPALDCAHHHQPCCAPA